MIQNVGDAKPLSSLNTFMVSLLVTILSGLTCICKIVSEIESGQNMFRPRRFGRLKKKKRSIPEEEITIIVATNI